MRSGKKRLKIMIMIFLVLLNFTIVINASDTLINMNFRDADVRDVFRTIAELADTNLVTDGSVSGSITIRLNNVSFGEALDLITQTYNLSYRWYEDTVVVATPERIDSIYAQMSIETVRLKYADLEETQQLLSSVFNELEVLTDRRNNEIVLKGKQDDITEAKIFISNMDTQKDHIAEILQVNYDDLDFLIDYVNRIYPNLIIENDGRNSVIFYGSETNIRGAIALINDLAGRLRDTRVVEHESMESVLINYADVSYIKSHIRDLYPGLTVIADTMNSQLILNGNENEIEQAKGFIARLDLAREEYELVTEVITVRSADIDAVASTILSFYPDMDIKTVNETNQLYMTARKDELAFAISIAENIDLQARHITRIKRVNYASFDDLNDIVTSIYPDINFRINSLNREVIVSGREDQVKEIISFVSEIDQPRQQVIIEARIEEIVTSDLKEIGVDPNQLSQIQFLDSNNSGFIDGLALTLPEFLNLLDANAMSTTLANPNLMAISGEEAKLLIGQRIPIPIRDQSGTVVQMEYIDAGINLEFLPIVGNDDRITLEVRPMISTIGESIGTSIPPINTREAETKVILEDGELMAIGGLIRDDVIESLSKVPLLGDIPILGELFRHRQSDTRKTEVIIFIRPRIVNSANADNIDEVAMLSDETENLENNYKEEKSNLESSRDNETESLKDDIVDNIADNRNAVEKEEGLGSVDQNQADIADTNEEKLEEEFDQVAIVDSKTNTSDEDKVEDNTVNDDNGLVSLSREQLLAILNLDEDEIAEEAKYIENAVLENEEIEENRLASSKESFSDDKSTNLENAKKAIQLDEYVLFNYQLRNDLEIDELAKKYNSSKDLIEHVNSDNIVLGSNIYIPVPRENIFIMNEGTTLWSLYRQYGVSVEELKEYNQIDDESNISKGAYIYIP
ncbi:secretin N-terminal domain-containing protein [Natronospora cellulosivora (SeqCode)]